MIKRDCHCLMCQGPAAGNYWDARDRRTAQCITDFGWNVMGVSGDEQTPGWAYSIGLWHTLGSAEVAIFGLDTQAAMRIVNIVGDQIRDGQPLQPDQRRADVIERFDVAVKPVDSSWYKIFFGAGIDFYQRPPLPVVQLVWPDLEGRFPWDAGADQELHAQQPMLWLSKQDHSSGMWTDHDPSGGWPFGNTLPYHTVQVTQDVLDGAAIVSVSRDPAGTWRFSAGTESPRAEATLGQIVKLHPSVADVSSLDAGQHAEVSDGGWQRQQVTRHPE